MEILSHIATVLALVLSVAIWVHTLVIQRPRINVSIKHQWFDFVSSTEVELHYYLFLVNPSSGDYDVTGITFMQGNISVPFMYGENRIGKNHVTSRFPIHLSPQSGVAGYFAVRFDEHEQPNYSIPVTLSIHTTHGTVTKSELRPEKMHHPDDCF